jgi:hypothetical protein
MQQVKQPKPDAEGGLRQLEDRDGLQTARLRAGVRLGLAARCHLGMSFDGLISHSPVSPVDGLDAQMSTPPECQRLYFHDTQNIADAANAGADSCPPPASHSIGGINSAIS